MMDQRAVIDAYLEKAAENLACAQAEHAAGRYNTSASRAYYAVRFAATAAAVHTGDLGFEQAEAVNHPTLRAKWATLIRRGLYPGAMRSTLTDLQGLRDKADYGWHTVTQREARIALEACGKLVDAVRVHRAAE